MLSATARVLNDDQRMLRPFGCSVLRIGWSLRMRQCILRLFDCPRVRDQCSRGVGHIALRLEQVARSANHLAVALNQYARAPYQVGDLTEEPANNVKRSPNRMNQSIPPVERCIFRAEQSAVRIWE